MTRPAVLRASLLTYRELSVELGVNRGTLKRWKSEGMPCHKTHEYVRFDLAEATAWIAAKRAHPNKFRRIRDCTFDRKAVVYFGVRDDGLYKIGWTSDVRRRSWEENFETLATLPGDKRIERLFQRAFQDDLVEGEWYSPSERLTAFVAGLAELQTKRAA